MVQGNDWSSVGKLIFKSSIRLLGSGQRLIECWKARFQEFDSFSWFRARTDRMLESSFSRVQFVYLVQGNDWSNVRKLVFKSSIPLLGSGQRLIERWKAHFQEFDSFTSVVALNQENESNSWKWAFQHSISRCPEPSKRIELLKTSFPTFDGSGQRLIECWKAHFQEFDSFSWFRATTDRMLESSFSRVRFVYLVQGNDWSNVGKLVFKSSIHLLGSGQGLIERWKARFQEFNSFTSVVALNQENESNSWKWAFQHSISPCPEPRKRIELLKTSFPTFDQSLPWTKKTNRTLENELSNIRSVVALNQENESNSWKRAFQHSISRCPEPRKRIELLKTSFPTFDQSLPWTKKTNRTLEKSFPTFDGSGQRLIECWKARFQEFDSFSRFRATTDRMLESSFQEFDSFSWFRATTDRMLENSFSRVQFLFFSRCPEPRKRIELLKTSFPTFDQSLPWTKKTNRTLEKSFPTFDQSLPWTK